MKREVRFLGIDDSPFTFEDRTVRVVGVVTRGASYVEGILSSAVEVDGSDATEAVARLVERTRFRPMLRAILVNGVTLGGFNLVDLDALWDRLKVPVMGVVRDEPDLPKSRRALEKHFPDAQARLEVWQRLRP
ncbi:MAG TPA: DUF99 family protein, partial [Candidatus Thermoplasmatota archaeon]|nr:DUF99 family protein [Candidatus Thermoplasmatota archaeon]